MGVDGRRTTGWVRRIWEADGGWALKDELGRLWESVEQQLHAAKKLFGFGVVSTFARHPLAARRDGGWGMQ